MLEVQQKLYCYESYFNTFINLYNSNKLPQSILFFGKEGIGKKTFITNLLLDFLKRNQSTTKYENKIDLLKHLTTNQSSNVRFIYNNDDDNFSVSIEQIRDILIYSSHSTLDGNPKFIVICNPEELNLNVLNSLLKIVESPPEHTYFLLISDNINKIINTLKSRCLKFKISFNISENKFIINNLLNDNNLFLSENKFFLSKFDTPGKVIKKLLFLNKNNLENKSILEIIIFCLESFKLKKNKSYLKFALDFSNIFFNQKFNSNFSKFHNYYDLFLLKYSDCAKYNVDFSSVINLLKRIY